MGCARDAHAVDAHQIGEGLVGNLDPLLIEEEGIVAKSAIKGLTGKEARVGDGDDVTGRTCLEEKPIGSGLLGVSSRTGAAEEGEDPGRTDGVEVGGGGSVQLEGCDALDIGEGSFIDRAVTVDLKGVCTRSGEGVSGGLVGRGNREEVACSLGPVEIEGGCVVRRVEEGAGTLAAENTGDSGRTGRGPEDNGARSGEGEGSESCGVREVLIAQLRCRRDDERVVAVAARDGVGGEHLAGENGDEVVASPGGKGNDARGLDIGSVTVTALDAGDAGVAGGGSEGHGVSSREGEEPDLLEVLKGVVGEFRVAANRQRVDSLATRDGVGGEKVGVLENDQVVAVVAEDLGRVGVVGRLGERGVTGPGGDERDTGRGSGTAQGHRGGAVQGEGLDAGDVREGIIGDLRLGGDAERVDAVSSRQSVGGDDVGGIDHEEVVAALGYDIECSGGLPEGAVARAAEDREDARSGRGIVTEGDGRCAGEGKNLESRDVREGVVGDLSRGSDAEGVGPVSADHGVVGQKGLICDADQVGGGGRSVDVERKVGCDCLGDRRVTLAADDGLEVVLEGIRREDGGGGAAELEHLDAADLGEGRVDHGPLVRDDQRVGPVVSGHDVLGEQVDAVDRDQVITGSAEELESGGVARPLREAAVAIPGRHDGDAGRHCGGIEGDGGSAVQREDGDSLDIGKRVVGKFRIREELEGVPAAAADDGIIGKLSGLLDADKVVALVGHEGRGSGEEGVVAVARSAVHRGNAGCGGLGVEDQVRGTRQFENTDVLDLGEGVVLKGGSGCDDDRRDVAGTADNGIGREVVALGKRDQVGAVAADDGEGVGVVGRLRDGRGAVAAEDRRELGRRGGGAEDDGGGSGQGESLHAGDLREGFVGQGRIRGDGEGVGTGAADDGVLSKLGGGGNGEVPVTGAADEGEGGGVRGGLGDRQVACTADHGDDAGLLRGGLERDRGVAVQSEDLEALVVGEGVVGDLR